MPGFGQPVLINILGHTAGALLFAIFLALLFSRRGWAGARGRHLSGLAAALSLAWNIGSLLVLVWPAMPPAVERWVVALSFSMLSLLPAVLLHVSLEDSRPRLVVSGYILSAAAVGMHFREILGNAAALHQRALLLITIGFLALTAATVAGEARRRPGGLRVPAAMCLALFAMSFVHFGTGHGNEAWSSELLVHHAGIPVALFLLLQDYRFVLLDAFVRFLANALLAATLSWLVLEAAFRLLPAPADGRDPLHQAVLLVGLSLALILFASLRNRVQQWVTRALFRQDGVGQVADTMKTGPPVTDEDSYLAWAAAEIAAAVRTAEYAVIPQAAEHPQWVEAAIPIRLGPGQARLLTFGRRRGGQRYLGEDLDALTRAAAEIEERVEAFRRQEMDRLVNQAELRALQSQVNPHFLFNALNALYGTIPREASGARRIVLRLAEIFRYFLQADQSFVTVAEEMEIVRAYLDVEQFRLGDRLQVEIDVAPEALEAQIPVLSVQPLVENAIKHGIARRSEPGLVRIRAVCDGDELRISIGNSGAGPSHDNGLGLGLQNVRRRLEICYGAWAGLELDLTDAWVRAEIRLPVKQPVRV